MQIDIDILITIDGRTSALPSPVERKMSSLSVQEEHIT